jgi:hypothetical protein
MGIKLAVRTSVGVNTKKYNRVEDMPPEARAAYEKAIGASASAALSANTITFNGETFDSVEAMPPEARRLYESVLASLPHGGTSPSASASGSPDRTHLAPAAARPDPALQAIEPAGVSRWLLAALALGAGLLAFWLLRRS